MTGVKMAKRPGASKRARKPILRTDPTTIHDALPAGAWWAITHARNGGGWVSAIDAADLASGIAWAVVEKTPGGRKFKLTELGGAVAHIADHRAAIAKKKGDAA